MSTSGNCGESLMFSSQTSHLIQRSLRPGDCLTALDGEVAFESALKRRRVVVSEHVDAAGQQALNLFVVLGNELDDQPRRNAREPSCDSIERQVVTDGQVVNEGETEREVRADALK